MSVEWTDEAREAAVEAAARRAAVLRDQEFDSLPPMERYAYREAVLPYVAAAMKDLAPHVEVTLREARAEALREAASSFRAANEEAPDSGSWLYCQHLLEVRAIREVRRGE